MILAPKWHFLNYQKSTNSVRAMPTEDEYSEDEKSGWDEEEEVKSGDISDDDDQADSDQACLSSLLLVYMFAAAVFRCLVTVSAPYSRGVMTMNTRPRRKHKTIVKHCQRQ